MKPLTLALPKGRLFEQVQEHFKTCGLDFSFDDRKLQVLDKSGRIQVILVKNADLPTYVNHGVAGLGVCGEDVVYESGHEFVHLTKFSFGGTRMCLAGRTDRQGFIPGGPLTVATKFTQFTRDYFHAAGIPVKIVKLDGSVELAPVLGLAPAIVDLVETGSTLKANGLEVFQELKKIQVNLFANRAYYKLNYKEINALVDLIQEKNL